MNKLTAKPLNEVFITVKGHSPSEVALWEHFTFKVPGYFHMPTYKNGPWDGSIRLYNGRTGAIYKGLLPRIKKFCKDREIALDVLVDDADEEFSLHEAEEFAKSLVTTMKARYYQTNGLTKSIRKRRALLLCPTASGKSMILYMLIRFYGLKTLLIVPSTHLVEQMYGDFTDYSDAEFTDMHKVMAGLPKESEKQVIISTWQSIYKQPKEYFKQFDLVIGDEVHLFKANSLKAIMEKLDRCVYRIGCTATLDGTQTHQLVLEGLFGKVVNLVSTKTLMDQGFIAKLKVKALVLKYDDITKKTQAKAKYQDEIDFLINCPERNRFIKNLALSLKGNTLVLFTRVEHGKELHKEILAKAGEREVFLIHGGVHAKDREKIRKTIETKSNAIIVASYGTFSTGVNIRNLHNIISGSPYKSRIKILQSIGRGLRLKDNKAHCTWFDIADDLRWKKWTNYGIKHYKERVAIYAKEKFQYKQYTVGVKCKVTKPNTLNSSMEKT